MESGPFSRRSWATQSLRITAKELSLVSGRGRNNAIAERFSKYQKAAEEASAEKKKSSVESATPSLRSGNLSALKKRWEQTEKFDRNKASSIQPSSQASARCRPAALNRPPSISENPPPLQSPDLLTAQEAKKTVASSVPQPSAAPKAPKAEKQGGMDSVELTHNEKPENLEAQVPTSPCASYEKPKVPLNNLKMKFEKGENKMDKVRHRAVPVRLPPLIIDKYH
uniref:LIM domain and actin binding 1a n=1 Tax=Mastacembelus armatus TaxID=205130 RepID=A0A7N9B027_9TELE